MINTNANAVSAPTPGMHLPPLRLGRMVDDPEVVQMVAGADRYWEVGFWEVSR